MEYGKGEKEKNEKLNSESVNILINYIVILVAFFYWQTKRKFGYCKYVIKMMMRVRISLLLRELKLMKENLNEKKKTLSFKFLNQIFTYTIYGQFILPSSSGSSSSSSSTVYSVFTKKKFFSHIQGKEEKRKEILMHRIK